MAVKCVVKLSSSSEKTVRKYSFLSLLLWWQALLLLSSVQIQFVMVQTSVLSGTILLASCCLLELVFDSLGKFIQSPGSFEDSTRVVFGHLGRTEKFQLVVRDLNQPLSRCLTQVIK